MKNYKTSFKDDREDIGAASAAFLVLMKLKYMIPFILFILLLVGSEYIFLNEFSNTQRISILTLSVISVLVSIFFIFLTIRRVMRDPK